jgi:hypothetical protein
MLNNKSAGNITVIFAMSLHISQTPMGIYAVPEYFQEKKEQLNW